jgi:hypothetical protein
MVYAAPPLRERALRLGRSGDDEAREGDRGGLGMPVLTSNPPPRSCHGVSIQRMSSEGAEYVPPAPQVE